MNRYGNILQLCDAFICPQLVLLNKSGTDLLDLLY